MKKKEFQNLPSTETPINAENLNEMQSNLEESCVVVSPTEPTTNEKVWIQKGKNLFDENKLIQGYTLDDTTGKEIINTNYMISDFIEVNSSTPYSFSENQNYAVTSGTMIRCVLYDKDKNFLSLAFYENRTEIKRYSHSFETTEDTKYVRFSLRITDTECQLEQSSEATEYEAYIDKVIWCKNDNGVFELFYKKEQRVDYSNALTKDDTYVESFTPLYCEVKNGIAYVNISINFIASSIGYDMYALIEGLPKPKRNIIFYGTRLKGAANSQPIRLIINTSGKLSWYYNNTNELVANEPLNLDIIYPV